MSDHATQPRPPRKRLKWEPVALMIIVAGLGLWLVLGPNPWHGPAPRPNARVVDFKLGTERGVLEINPGEPPTFRILLRHGFVSRDLSADEFRELYGEESYQLAVRNQSNLVFRLLNITSWTSLTWIAIGLVGQIAFTGRMVIQWLVSERKKQSVVPEMFWWLSLGGGAMLFFYFVWRQDFVGVLGQSSGIVIYARNIRLIYKQRRRLAQTIPA